MMTDEARLQALWDYIDYIVSQGWGCDFWSNVPARAGKWLCIWDSQVPFYLRMNADIVRQALAEAVERGIIGPEGTADTWYGYFAQINQLNTRVLDCRAIPGPNSIVTLTIARWLAYDQFHTV